MSREVLDHAVEPFCSTRRDGKGTGLGRLCGFARQSGGSASIENPSGAGVQVTPMLPLAC